MKSNTKGKLILICLVAMLSLSFVFGSNVANYSAKLSENPVNASEKNVENPSTSSNGVFKRYWKANGREITDSQDIQTNIYRIISDGQGGAIIAFQETNGGTSDIYAQKINSNGDRLWGVNGTLICNAPNHQYDLAICLDGSGGAIITWEDWRYGNPNLDIYAQRVSYDGTTHWGESWWSGPGDLNGTVICNATGGQWTPQICAIEGGGAIIAWNDPRTGSDIYAQKVSSDGTTHWGESWWSGPGDLNGTVISNATVNQGQVMICSDGANGAIVTWNDQRSDMDIYAQRVSSDGTTYWGESWWSGPGDRNGTVICNATNAQDWPQICSVEGGGAIIVWEDYRNGIQYDTYAQRVSLDGTTHWGESWWSGQNDLNGTVICNATGGQSEKLICSNEAGGAFITWTDERDPLSTDIYAQNVSSDGTTYWGESWWSGPGDRNGTVICNNTKDQTEPSICADGSGYAIVVWEDRRQGIGQSDIYAQRVSSDGVTHWGDGSLWGGTLDLNGTAICNIEGKNAFLNDVGPAVPSICSDNSNGVIIAWWDMRGTGKSMYAQRVGIRSPIGGALPSEDDDDDDDEDTGLVIVVVVIIIIACVGGVVVVVIVLIKKGIIGTSKLKRG